MQCGDTKLNLISSFFSFLGNPIKTILDLVSNFVLAAAVQVFGGLVRQVPTLTGTSSSKTIGSQTQWIVVYLAVGSLLFAAGRMALERRADAGKTAMKGILRVILVSGAATTVVMAAASVADDYSKALFDESVKTLLAGIGSCSGKSTIESFLMLVLAFLLLISGIIHTILMYIRLGVMILMLGTLPMAAAASMTDWGGGWWRKHIAWMVAWLLYKPAVGLILYAGTVMISSSKGTSPDAPNEVAFVSERIAGIGVMLLSAIALPALLKLIVPATAALGSGNPMSTVGGAAGSLATGAVRLGGGGSGSGSGGSGGGMGPKGPSGAASSGGGSAGSGGASGSNGSAGASGSNGSSGSAGAGSSGSSGGASGSGGSGGGGSGGGGVGGGAASGGRAASGAGAGAAAGPAAAATIAAVTVASAAAKTVSGAVEGAGEDTN
ncbi:hypothetical protein ACIQNU_25110 [Streptomyces sp. NPDC091292]|uniref:hypothetical protein n=1 Tax=Streptomyces sp. NPDC091292 TaxID=3365991 RepID=UPI0037FA1EA4